MIRKMFLAALAGLLLAATVYAHHSLGATYDGDKEIKLEGKIVQFLLRNPHSFLHIEAKDAKGEMQRWSLEWRSAGSLSQQGVNRDTLKLGDDVVITASPSRTPSDYRGVLKTLYRKSDGLGWGTRPGETVE
jgi:hypothetical protein